MPQLPVLCGLSPYRDEQGGSSIQPNLPHFSLIPFLRAAICLRSISLLILHDDSPPPASRSLLRLFALPRLQISVVRSASYTALREREREREYALKLPDIHKRQEEQSRLELGVSGHFAFAASTWNKTPSEYELADLQSICRASRFSWGKRFSPVSSAASWVVVSHASPTMAGTHACPGSGPPSEPRPGCFLDSVTRPPQYRASTWQ